MMRGMLAAVVLLAGAVQAPDVDMSLDIEVGTKRAPTPAMNQFRKQTGYPNGRPGWVVDHLVAALNRGSRVQPHPKIVGRRRMKADSTTISRSKRRSAPRRAGWSLEVS